MQTYHRGHKGTEDDTEDCLTTRLSISLFYKSSVSYLCGLCVLCGELCVPSESPNLYLRQTNKPYPKCPTYLYMLRVVSMIAFAWGFV